MNKDPINAVYADSTYQGVRYIILRGPVCLVAYVEVPDKVTRTLEQLCRVIYSHGPITYVGVHNNKHSTNIIHQMHKCIGWDYGHHGDKLFDNGRSEWTEFIIKHILKSNSGKAKHLIPEVKKDCISVCEQLLALRI